MVKDVVIPPAAPGASWSDRLASKRRELVTARADLRAHEDRWAEVQLRAECAAIERGSLGSNETERKRALQRAVDEDAECVTARTDLRRYQQLVEALQAEIDILHDTRRWYDITTRERIIDLVESGTLAASDVVAALSPTTR